MGRDIRFAGASLFGWEPLNSDAVLKSMATPQSFSGMRCRLAIEEWPECAT
jgi:hypothetical protein